MIKIYFIVLTLLWNACAFTQEVVDDLQNIPRTYLVLKPFETNLVNSFEQNQITKIMLQVSSKQKTYHLLMMDVRVLNDEQKANITELSLNVLKQDDLYLVEAELTDIKKNKKIKIRRVRDIERKDLQRTIYLVLESLFDIEDEKKNSENQNLKKAI